RHGRGNGLAALTLRGDAELVWLAAGRPRRAGGPRAQPGHPSSGIPWHEPAPAGGDSSRLLTPFRFGGEFVPGNGKNRPWPSSTRLGIPDAAISREPLPLSALLATLLPEA